MKKTLLYFVFLYGFNTLLAQNFTAGGVNYTVTSATAPFTVKVANNINYTGALVVPETVTNEAISYAVTSIENDAFENCAGLTSVNTGNSVTIIGNYAFGHCGNLSSVTIGNAVTSIGNYAFQYCIGL
ncbi:hypothetical protein RCH18_001246 [Flavobacterium sp. PL11]|uniref:leucine-rich repeat domain-containing protein n=1 Tax=Flavobacterium sp. PL11 TaxID=3071717 RepID=UPI002E050461|nr:hypothetical protein [Flavobacterium sp. PL11]